MESLFHSLKTELVMHCDYKTRDEARASLFEYMEVFYNRQRRHSAIKNLTPLVFEASTTAKTDCPLNVGNFTFGHLLTFVGAGRAAGTD
jgi:transposase InsO family protein